MFTITETIEAARHRNDFLRSISEPQPVGAFDEGEVRIRTQLRANVRDELKYTTKGKRGAGKTYEAILIRISNARRHAEAASTLGYRIIQPPLLRLHVPLPANYRPPLLHHKPAVREKKARRKAIYRHSQYCNASTIAVDHCCDQRCRKCEAVNRSSGR